MKFNKNKQSDFISKLNLNEIYMNIRMHLKEDDIKME